MNFFFVIGFVLVANSQLLYNLSRTFNATIPLQLDQSILSIENGYFNSFYAVTTKNNNSFRIISCDPNNFYSLIGTTPSFSASIDPTSQQAMNPTLYVLSNRLVVIYKIGNWSIPGATQLIIDPNNLNSFNTTNVNNYYIAVYFRTIDVFYFKNQIGNQYYFPNSTKIISSSNPVSVYINPSYANSTYKFRIYRVSSGGVVSVDMHQNIINIIQISKNNNIVTVNLNTYSFSGFCSLCFGSNNNLFVHSTNGLVYSYTFPSFTQMSSYGPSQQLSQYCYYDTLTTSVILVNAVFPQNITFQQIVIGSPLFSSIVTLQNSIGFQFKNTYIYSINSPDIGRFQSASCNNQLDYFSNNFSCIMCNSRCKLCYGIYECSICSQSYVLMNDFCCSSNQYVQITAVSNQTVKSCINCVNHCKTCDNQTCLQCYNHYDLINGSCYLSGQFNNSNSNTNTTNDTNTNSSNSTNSTNIIYILNQTAGINAVVNSMVSNSLLAFLNKIPSARTIFKPILNSLVCFDDLYLYQFHQRNYGNTLNNLFIQIQNLEQEKWSALDSYIIQNIFGLFNTNLTQFTSHFDKNINYSSPRFVEVQGNGEGFFINSWSFITTNFITSAAIYLVFKLFFHLFFRYKISLNFRVYSFKSYFPFFLLEGNLQTLIFYLASSVTLSFQISVSQKFFICSSYLTLFSLFVFSVSGYIYLHTVLSKLIKYFVQNMLVSVKMIVFLTFEFGLKNVLMGFTHNLFRSQDLFRVQLTLLILIQSFCLLNYIYFLSIKHFQYKAKIWVLTMMALTRVILIITLCVQQSYLQTTILINLCQTAISVIVSVYIGLLYVSLMVNILIFIGECLYNLITSIHKYFKNSSNKLIKIRNIASIKTKTENPLCNNPKLLLHNQMMQRISCSNMVRQIIFKNGGRSSVINMVHLDIIKKANILKKDSIVIEQS